MEEDLFQQNGINTSQLQQPVGQQNSEPQAPDSPDLFADYGVDPSQPVDKYSAIKDKLMENILRPVARAGRTTLSGLAGISDPINMALGMPLASESTKQLFDRTTGGFAAPRNKTEEIVDTAGELFSGGVGVGKSATLAASKGGKYAQAIGKTLGIETAPQVAGLVGASTAIPVSQEATQKALDVFNIAPDSNLRTVTNIASGLVGGVAGGIAGAKMTNIPVNLKNWNITKTLPEATSILGRSKVANQTLKDLETKGISPQEIDAELNSDAGIGLRPIDVSKSNISNIQDLAQIAASRKVLQNSFNDVEKKIIKSQNDILNGVEPDENALKDLSQAYIGKLKTTMQQNAKPLYDKAFENAKFKTLPLDSTIINRDGQEINLKTLLSRPDIKQALVKSRQAAVNAKGTSASKFYQDETKGLKDSNPIVLHNLQSYLRRNSGNLDKLLPDAEEASLMAKRGDILQFLDENLVGYKDARGVYSADLEELMKAQKGTKGIIANLQADKGADAMKKLYRLSPNEIVKVKNELIAINPDKYNSAAKSFFDGEIATLRQDQTLASLIKNPQKRAKYKALFPNAKTFDGFERSLTYIEKTKPVQDALKRALDQDIKSTSLIESIPQQDSMVGKGIKAIPRATGRVLINPITNKITSQLMLQEGITGRNIKSIDTRQAEVMAKYAFTDEGRQLYQALAKATKKVDIDQLMTQIYLQSGFLTTLSNATGGNNNPSLMSDAEAKEPTQQDLDQLRERYKQAAPITKYMPDDQELKRIIR